MTVFRVLVVMWFLTLIVETPRALRWYGVQFSRPIREPERPPVSWGPPVQHVKKVEPSVPYDHEVEGI